MRIVTAECSKVLREAEQQGQQALRAEKEQLKAAQAREADLQQEAAKLRGDISLLEERLSQGMMEVEELQDQLVSL
jgi:predicted nuclease with TOPRIM domain